MIPIYEAVINDESEGIYKISLVDFPAVESDFLAFKKEDKTLMRYVIQDEEQKTVFGVLMRADFNIYRYNENLGEFYVRYSKDTIKKMAEKLMADGVHNNINLQHCIDTDGVNLIQLFIKDESKGVSPKGFEGIEDGSLFAVYKVNNETVWQSIKEGVFRGFSLEGYFEMKPISNQKTMNKFNKIKQQILSILLAFSEIQTDKGKIYWSGEEAIKEGDEVYAEVEGEKRPLESGDYITEEGKVITVIDGVVSWISEPQPEQKEDEESATFEEEPTKETTDDEGEEKDSDLKAEVSALKAELENLKAKINEILSAPVTKPIAEEFEKAITPEKTKLSRAVEIASALKK